jgi:hypothetical protein
MVMPERVSAAYTSGNSVIDTLPTAERERIIPHLSVFEVEVPDYVVPRDAPFHEVLFPLGAIFSVTATLAGGHTYEVAATGKQGLIGAELALGVAFAPRSILAQVGGSSAAMDPAVFLQCLARSMTFAQAVHRHMVRRLFIAEQFVACNFVHSLTQRCARWILMVRDEAGRDEFGLRRDFLGMMLGLEHRHAERATETLRSCGAIHYANEVVSVLQAESLAEFACECYEAQRWLQPTTPDPGVELGA